MDERFPEPRRQDGVSHIVREVLAEFLPHFEQLGVEVRFVDGNEREESRSEWNAPHPPYPRHFYRSPYFIECPDDEL